ncbi:TolC family outer membrane protein [Massilia antarctica]|uniref:TolC family outer membrane protein n=1 Tax=Massilia antarctica TaxID=2765360 RepID=UPI0006BB7DA4|nr:TolC family outer membrane protein [Massilia sp. H27-R4]MCY0916036.1 TolC family outer membrane protein [Massilia sp. H27-R4]CUI05658.1 Type I secretion outer membrane protein, TolC precursor [Janthinobacterium sp. CG23_2]CUU29444.1 Type I secretion outer membrane protein, TolC precursor [Janthinobacterium sp. CG23_2]
MQKPLMAVLIASAFFSLNAQAADLIQVYQQALANDAAFASARAALAAGMERVPQGRSLLLPTVGLNGSIVKNDSDSTPWNIGQTVTLANGSRVPVTSGGANERTTTHTLSLTQPLFRWANWQSYEQSKLQQAQAEAQFAQAQQDLITRVAQAYFDVLAAQDTLELSRAQKTATTEQLASAKRNFEVGTQTITDTHEAQAAYDLVVAQEFAAINDLENKRSALQAIIGTAPSGLATLKQGVLLASPEPAVIDPWVSSAESQNYGVVGAQLSYELSKREIQKSRAGHYPTLDLTANISRQNMTGQTQQSGRTENKGIGIAYNVPIFNGFAVTSRVRETIALEDKARNDLEATRRNAANVARQAFLGVNSGLAQVKALQAAEVSSNSALESNKLGYQVGVRINIDVLNAQRQLYSTRRDLSRARYDTILNGLRLKSAAGSLREADLVPVNDLLVK